MSHGVQRPSSAPDPRRPGADGARGGAGRRTRSLGPLGLALAACGAVGALAALGVLPAALLGPAAAPLLFGGAALPFLARAAPEPASPVKLFVFASLLSPLALTTLDVLARALLGPGEAHGPPVLAALLTLAALAQWGTRGARVQAERLGLGTWLALAIALAFAGWTASVLLDGSAPRVSFHGLLHSGLALATERQVPPTNPWLGGEPLGYYWAWHALGGFTMRALGLAPTVALAVIGLWSALLAALSLHLLGAALFRSARRELAGTLFALLGLNALGGLLLLARGSWPEAPPSTNGELLVLLREALVPVAGGELAWDPRVAFGPSKFGNLSSYPAALALALGAHAAAAHALRHGHGLWIALCALTAGGSLALNPLVGAATVGVIGATAFVAGNGPRARFGLLAALAVAAVPGLWLVRAASAALGGTPVEFALDLRRVAAVLGPWAALLPVAAFGARNLARELPREDPRRAVLWLLGLGVAANALVAAAVELPYANEYKFVRLGALPLGLLAAAGAFAGGPAARRLLGAALALPLVVGAAATDLVGARAYAALSEVDLPLVEAPGRLAPSPGPLAPMVDARDAYAWLAEDPTARAARPLLMVDLARTVGLPFGADADGEGGFAFTRAANLQAHEAVAFGAVDLFVDRPSQVLSATGRVVERRAAAVADLFGGKEPWREATRRLMFDSERPVLVWVGPFERKRSPRLEAGLERLNFRTVFEAGGVRLHLAPGPGTAAWERAAGAETYGWPAAPEAGSAGGALPTGEERPEGPAAGDEQG